MIIASEPAREILQNTNICKIHGFVDPFTPGTNGAVRTQFTLSHAIPVAELIAVADRALYWPSKRVAIRFGPRSRERRMPRAPKRCLGNMQVVVNDEDTVGQPHSLGPVRNGLLVRPPRRYDTSAQIGEIPLRNVDVEGADRVRCRVRQSLRPEKY
jgi:hypothetical protein